MDVRLARCCILSTDGRIAAGGGDRTKQKPTHPDLTRLSHVLVQQQRSRAPTAADLPRHCWHPLSPILSGTIILIEFVVGVNVLILEDIIMEVILIRRLDGQHKGLRDTVPTLAYESTWLILA